MSFKSFKPHTCRRAFKRKGFEENVKSDHCYFYFIVKGKRTRIFTKLSHTSKKSIGKRLFSKISKDLGVSKEFLREFIDCDKKKDDLTEILISQNRIPNNLIKF